MSYLPRTLEKVIEQASSRFKVVMVSGMRQVGKSTLLKRKALPDRRLVTLDNTSRLMTAKSAPELFLQQFPAPALIDEIQLAPELFRPLKAAVDESEAKGQYWITGSQRFSLMKQVTDTLPGRLIAFELMPLSLYERDGLGALQQPYFPSAACLATSRLPWRNPDETWQVIWQGAWPEVIHDDATNREWFFNSLIDLYISRDVAQLANVSKTLAFRRFLVALAFLSGQELRLNTLAEMSGVDTVTARRWLSIAEASGVIYLLKPFERNIGKQLVKSPRLYMADTGLMAVLLNIQTPEEMMRHTMAGHFYETFVVMEIVKSWVHNGKVPDICFLRESRGMEVDLLIHQDGKYFPVEIKAGLRPALSDAKWILKLESLGIPVGMASVISMAAEPYALSSNIIVHGIWNM